MPARSAPTHYTNGGVPLTARYVIRLADSEHVALLPAIERAAATRFGDSLPECILSHVTPLDVLAVAQQGGLLWVALEPGGAPVGFAIASIHGPRVHLEELDVSPEYGRQGIGSSLVAAVQGFARARGCRELTLTTFCDIPWNAPLYERLGFAVIPDPQLDAQLLERLAYESELGLERSRRVAMRKPLGRPTSLVVFYSHTGATRRIAAVMAEHLSADICELVPDPPYTGDYMERAKREKQGGYGPKLQRLDVNLVDYDTIFVGSPNWFSTFAPPITTLLLSADLSGKTIVPFCTHGSGGVGRIDETARALCPSSTVLDVIGFYSDATAEQVTETLGRLGF